MFSWYASSVLIGFSTNVSDVPPHCINANTSSIYTFMCPFHGWEAIQNFIYTTYHSVDDKYVAVTGFVSSPAWVEVTGQSSQRRLSLVTDYDEVNGDVPEQVVATTQQSAVADALSETGSLWTSSVSSVSRKGHGSVLQRQDAVHAISSGYYQPYTSALCATDVIRSPHDDSAVAFPFPPGVQPDMMLGQYEYNDSILGIPSFLYAGLTRDQILSTAGSIEESRLKWVELPQDPFNGSAIGAVILLPRSVSNYTQELIVCNLGAGWGSSFINTSTFDSDMTFMTSVVDPSAKSANQWDNSSDYNSSASQGSESQDESIAVDKIIQYDLPFFPEKPVTVTEDWAHYLNPFVPALNATVIDILMSTSSPIAEMSILDQISIAEMALAGLLANGLASIGATAKLQGDIKTIVNPDGSSEFDGDYWFSGKGDVFIVDPDESKDWVKFRVYSTIDGYAYNIRGAGEKVAIAILLTYCFIALSHVVYAGISGKVITVLPCTGIHLLTTQAIPPHPGTPLVK